MISIAVVEDVLGVLFLPCFMINVDARVTSLER